MHFSSPFLFRSFQATLLFLVLSFQGVAQAPSFAWAKSAGGGYTYGIGVAVDGSGNSYITGYFYGTATFGSTTLTSSGAEEVFIAKYDASGSVLWAQKAGGTDTDTGRGIAVDGSGNSYVTGSFRGSTTFGSTTLNSSSLDIFTAKYDASGNVLWAQKGGGTGLFDEGYGIAVDGSGNSYITGAFADTATFGSTTVTSSSFFADVFIVKYDAFGNVLWAQKAGGTNIDVGTSIAVDGSDNSYVTGVFRNTATFGSTTLNSSSNGDVFITKLGTLTGLPSDISAALPTYPNPFRTSFQLSLPGTGPATVVLTDVLGREVHRQAVAPPAAESTATISPAAHLPFGVYGLQIMQDGAVKQGKVLKE
jgi:hypothetical protein